MTITIITCYFGRFNNITSWINSCKNNPDFNFILFTDQDISTNKPKNLKIVKTTLDKIKHRMESKLRCHVELNDAYKLCDYKPMFGYIFEEYIEKDDFWGYCDTDVVFGNLKTFVTNDILKKYDRVFILGHLSLYKNTKFIRELFLKDDTYKQVCSDNRIFIYDEKDGIGSLFKKFNLLQYNSVDYADISPNINRLTLAPQDNRTINHKDNYQSQIFAYIDGSVYRFYIHNNKITKQEFAYLHFSTRHFKDTNASNYLITPKGFVPISKKYKVTEKTIKRYNKSNGKFYEKIEYLFNHYRRRIINYKKYYR